MRLQVNYIYLLDTAGKLYLHSLIPSPSKPSAHTQEKLPTVLVQVALRWHTVSRHCLLDSQLKSEVVVSSSVSVVTLYSLVLLLNDSVKVLHVQVLLTRHVQLFSVQLLDTEQSFTRAHSSISIKSSKSSWNSDWNHFKQKNYEFLTIWVWVRSEKCFCIFKLDDYIIGLSVIAVMPKIFVDVFSRIGI